MADLAQLESALVKADAAGDADGARVLAGEIRRMRSEAPPATGKPKKDLSWSDVPGEALFNIPRSAANFASGIYQAVRHPIDTASNVLDIGAGALRNAMPDALVNTVEGGKPNPSAIRASEMASGVGQFYKDRYGSLEGLKNTIATDPVGVSADLSTVLAGGAALAPKASALAKGLRQASNLTNPVSVLKPAAKIVGGVGKQVLGLTTGTGAEPVGAAAKAGYAGKSAFWENLTGKVNATDVLDDAKAAIAEMGKQKSAAYRSGMANIADDKTVLQFGAIDKAIADAKDIATFKGQVKNAKAAKVLNEITDEVSNWKKLKPAEFHTPEGLDALKQKIGGIAENLPFEEKTARLVARNIYNTVKDEITNQAPTYAKTMKGYSEATEQIREIERALSLGQKAAADTGMRKLQSLMRNNVNTNYGNRLELAKALSEKGGKDLFPAIAGQAMNSWTARGLGGQAENLVTAGLAAFHNPVIAAALPFQSPKAIGAALYGGGRVAGMMGDAASKAGITSQRAKLAALLAEQAGRERVPNAR